MAAVADENEILPPPQVRPEEEEAPEEDVLAEGKEVKADNTRTRTHTAAKPKPAPKNKAKAKAKAKSAPKTVMKSALKSLKRPAAKSKGGSKGSKGRSKGSKGGSKGSKAEEKDVKEPKVDPSKTPMKKSHNPPEAHPAPKKRQRPAAADDKTETTTERNAKSSIEALFEKMPVNTKEQDDEKEDAEEEKEFDEDKEVEDVEDIASRTTDRSKKQKFLAMLCANQLPSHIVSMWHESTSMKTGRLERQRMMINSLFDRSVAGRLILNTNKPIFTSQQSSYEDYSTTKRNKSLTKVLFCGKFNLSEDLFQQGLSNGDFQEIVEDGKIKYTWSSNVEQNSAGSRTETAAKAEVQGEKGDVKKFFPVNRIDGLAGLGSPVTNYALPPGCPGPEPIMDKTKEFTAEQWKIAQSQLQPRMAAMDKLEKEGLKMVQLVGCDNKQDQLFVKLFLGCYCCCCCLSFYWYFTFLITVLSTVIIKRLQVSKSLCWHQLLK